MLAKPEVEPWALAPTTEGKLQGDVRPFSLALRQYVHLGLPYRHRLKCFDLRLSRPPATCLSGQIPEFLAWSLEDFTLQGRGKLGRDP